MYPPSIQKLIEIFSRFPTIGPKTAARFVFYLLKLQGKEIDDILNSIENLKKSIRACSFCFNSFESKTEENLCNICSNKGRDFTTLCVIEKEADLVSIENIKKYKGLYFILGGTLPAVKKEETGIRVDDLEQRIKNPGQFIEGANFKEIILALNPTPEGEATSLFLERKLKDIPIKITHLAKGIPVGGELEYADQETIENAIERRN